MDETSKPKAMPDEMLSDSNRVRELSILPVTSDWVEMNEEQEAEYENQVELKRNFLLKFIDEAVKAYRENLDFKSEEFYKWFRSNNRARQHFERYQDRPEQTFDDFYFSKDHFGRSYCNPNWQAARGLEYNDPVHVPIVFELISRLSNLSVTDLTELSKDAEQTGGDFGKVESFFDLLIYCQPAKGIRLAEIGGEAIARSAQLLGADVFSSYKGWRQTPWIGLNNWQETVGKDYDFTITERVFDYVAELMQLAIMKRELQN